MPVPCQAVRRGVTLLEVVVVVAIVGVLLALALPAVQKARDASLRSRCMSNMRQLGLGLHQYHDAARVLPPGITHPGTHPGDVPRWGEDVAPYPLMSWHARLLPYLEQGGLWGQMLGAYSVDPFSLKDPPHVGRTTSVSVFLCPADGQRVKPGYTAETSPATISYVGVNGVSQYRRDGLLYVDSTVRMTQITDGTSSTLMVAERPPDSRLVFGTWYPDWGPWWVAKSTLGVREVGVEEFLPGCPPGPYDFGPGSLAQPCSVFHYWSLHPGGAHFLFADGSVRFLSYGAASVLPALATRAGGEAVALPD
jgi:prepilin-type N-terminal cleavage/methylation domain-containing protein/prepilin-type processing-associated H-X9-DG protein